MSNDLPNLSGDGMDSANTGSGQEINTIININNNDKINSSADINTHSYANYGSTEYDAGSDSDNDDGGDNSDSDDNHQTAQVEYSDLSTLFSSEVLYLPALVETEEVPFKGKKGRLKTKRVNITNDLNTIRTSSLEKVYT